MGQPRRAGRSAGSFVSIDGPSGVGKTTVCARLHRRLLELGEHSVLTATPSGDTVGGIARAGTHTYHGLALTCLVAADRFHHSEIAIKPALHEGQFVVCDRYVPSSFILDGLEGTDFEYLWSLYRPSLQPSFAVILTDTAEACLARALQRGNYSRFHSNDIGRAQQEHNAVNRAIEFLSAHSYPVQPIAVDSQEPDVVVDIILELVRRRVG